jgi:hypothetical protein
MTRDEVIKANPRAIIEWYETRLRMKGIEK